MFENTFFDSEFVLYAAYRSFEKIFIYNLLHYKYNINIILDIPSYDLNLGVQMSHSIYWSKVAIMHCWFWQNICFFLLINESSISFLKSGDPQESQSYLHCFQIKAYLHYVIQCSLCCHSTKHIYTVKFNIDLWCVKLKSLRNYIKFDAKLKTNKIKDSIICWCKICTLL